VTRKTALPTLSLFSVPSSTQADDAPLALRMSPRTLDEWAGQEHLLGEGKLLRRAVVADRLSSAIFFRPARVRQIRPGQAHRERRPRRRWRK